MFCATWRCLSKEALVVSVVSSAACTPYSSRCRHLVASRLRISVCHLVRGVSSKPDKSRLIAWLRLQQELPAKPSDEERREAARKAWIHIAGKDCELHVEEEEFVALLEDVAICSAFSTELHAACGPLRSNLFVAEEAFGHSPQRRQYFRNQMLRLLFEKAILIRQAIESLEMDTEGVAWAGVLNTVHLVDDAEILKRVDLMFSTKEVPYLIGFGPGDLFLLSIQSDRELEAGSAVEMFLGCAEVVVAEAGSRVSLLRLLLYPIWAQPGFIKALEGKTCHIVPLEYIPYLTKLQKQAVLKLCNRDECYDSMVQELLLPSTPGTSFADTYLEQFEHRAPADLAPLSSADWASLNNHQRAAVEAARKNRLTLIQGPPGTGKSHVAVAIVMAWLQQDLEAPILVATGTHTAKNLIARRLRELGLQLSERKDLLRSKPPPWAKDAVPVFVETVYMAAVPESRRLPRVLIDESTQITEAAALVALGQGCEHLVLVGDPQQLGPVSNLGFFKISTSSEATAPVYSPYDLERTSIFEQLQQRHDLTPLHLREQYRMDPRICSYPSERFYDGELVNSDHLALGDLPGDFPLPKDSYTTVDGDQSHPVWFVDTSLLKGKHEERIPRLGRVSLRNRLEAAIILYVLRSLFDIGVAEEEVGVLSAYGAQHDYLFEVIHQRGAQAGRQWQERANKALLQGADPLEEDQHHPRVSTIDGYQGCEADFILFSATRSSQEGDTGFVGDRHRMCVLLTRARRGLVVVGDAATLKNDEEWAQWLEQAPKHHVRFSQDMAYLACEEASERLSQIDPDG